MSRDDGVRYVLFGTPLGRIVLAEKVREPDGDMIKDTKEDMDTLLVFVRYHLLYRSRSSMYFSGWSLLGSSHCLSGRILPETTS